MKSSNGKFIDECLTREWFVNRKDAKTIAEKWRHHYNYKQPYSSLNDQPRFQVESMWPDIQSISKTLEMRLLYEAGQKSLELIDL